MPRQMAKLLLPFAVPAKDRVKAFTEDVEMAAVFYLAESDREKGGGRILKKPAEKLAFIAEVCYPIWSISWRGKNLLFDGLGVTVCTLSYDVLPDVKGFSDDIQRSAETREAYSAALSDNASYFQDFASKEEKTLEGLITSPDFIQDIMSYLPEGERIEKPVIGKVFLSPTIDEQDISTSIKEMSNLRRELMRDINDLGEGMKLLTTTTREQVKVIHEETREIKKKFDEKIETIKPKVTDRVQKTKKKCDEEITKLSKDFERRLRPLHKDLIKLEKRQERLNLEIDRCEAGIKSCRLLKDEGRELQWSQKLEKIKKELPTLQKNIRDMNDKIEDVEDAKKLEIGKLRAEYETYIEEAMKDLRELEASREAGIKMKQQEIKTLEDTTSSIINQMNRMIKLKKSALNELDKMGTMKSQRDHTLVYLPLYLACYESESKKRYMMYPPSVVGSMGILTKLKGVFGATRMKSLLQPRSKAIATFLNQLVPLVKENPVFEKEVNDAGMQASILRTTESRIGIKKGLKELRDENWISESELETFSKLL